MNRMVRNYLDRIEGQVARLETGIGRQRDRIDTLREARLEAQKQFWQASKEAKTLEASQAAFEALRDENARLHARRQELQARLDRVLGYAKALSDAMRQ